MRLRRSPRWHAPRRRPSLPRPERAARGRLVPCDARPGDPAPRPCIWRPAHPRTPLPAHPAAYRFPLRRFPPRRGQGARPPPSGPVRSAPATPSRSPTWSLAAYRGYTTRRQWLHLLVACRCACSPCLPSTVARPRTFPARPAGQPSRAPYPATHPTGARPLHALLTLLRLSHASGPIRPAAAPSIPAWCGAPASDRHTSLPAIVRRLRGRRLTYAPYSLARQYGLSLLFVRLRPSARAEQRAWPWPSPEKRVGRGRLPPSIRALARRARLCPRPSLRGPPSPPSSPLVAPARLSLPACRSPCRAAGSFCVRHGRLLVQDVVTGKGGVGAESLEAGSRASPRGVQLAPRRRPWPVSVANRSGRGRAG